MSKIDKIRAMFELSDKIDKMKVDLTEAVNRYLETGDSLELAEYVTENLDTITESADIASGYLTDPDHM